MDEQKEELHQENQPIKKNKRFTISKPTYYALIAIFAAVFVLSGIYLGGYLWETGKGEKTYDDLSSLRDQAAATRPSVEPSTGSSEGPTEPQPLVILPELQPIYELNSELVGYLDFPYEGLNMQFPVMQRMSDSDYYLNHDFYGKESIAGCPYVPTTCDVFEPSDNVVIYGHNLRTGGMFNKLTYYREKSYWENHQTFYFDTLYERHTYQIFAVFKTAAAQYDKNGNPWGYPYHRKNNFDDAESFDKFIADIKGAAFNGGGYQGWTFYDTGITPQFGDKLLCLTTCEYTMRNPNGSLDGRLVVMAVRIK